MVVWIFSIHSNQEESESAFELVGQKVEAIIFMVVLYFLDASDIILIIEI